MSKAISEADGKGARRASDAAGQAYAAVRAAILSGVHPVGARLREEELAEAIGVSRTPIREALRRLDAEGIVELMPNRGAHVASWSDRDLDEIFTLRSMLESYGARLAAARIGPSQLERLRQLAAAMEHARGGHADTAVDEIAELNNEFHQIILRATGNRRLVALLSHIVELALMHRTFRRFSAEDLTRSLAHHRELIVAFERGDARWAESIMRAHVLAARNALRAPTADPLDGTPRV